MEKIIHLIGIIIPAIGSLSFLLLIMSFAFVALMNIYSKNKFRVISRKLNGNTYWLVQEKIANIYWQTCYGSCGMMDQTLYFNTENEANEYKNSK